MGTTMNIEILRINTGRPRLPVLMTLFLEVTLRCNAYCEHCGSNCGMDQAYDKLSADAIKNTLYDVASKYQSKRIMLNVAGGEPLLREDLFDIMTHATELGFPWGMTTNGFLVNNSIIEEMKKSGMQTISVSLNGLKSTHEKICGVANCYEKVINNIKLLKEAGFLDCLQITTVVSKNNIHELEELYNLVIALDVDSWRVMQVDSIGRARDNDSLLLEKNELLYLYDFIAKKRKISNIEITTSCSHYLGNYEMKLRDWSFACNAGVNIASILSNGDIYVCPSVERHHELIQGNIQNDSFIDVWENRFEYFRMPERLNISTCADCVHRSNCMGDSFHTWDFHGKTPSFCAKEIGLFDYPSEEDENNNRSKGIRVKFIHPTNGYNIDITVK